MEKRDEKVKVPWRVTMRRLLSLARPEATPIIVGTVFLLIGAATQLAMPQGIRYLIKAIESGSQEQINQVAALMGGVAFVLGFSVAFRFTLFSNTGERVVAKLRSKLFEALMSQEIAFFDGQKTGELSSRLASDTTVLQNTVSASISMVLRNLTAAVGGVVVLIWMSPRLTVLMMSIVPPVALGAVAYARRVRKLSREVQDSLAKSSEVAVESLSGIRTVRSFAAERSDIARYVKAVDESLQLAYRRTRLTSTFIGVVSFATYAAALVVFWYGGKLVLQKAFGLPELIAFLTTTVMVAASLGALSELWADFNRAAGAAERVFELLERQPKINAEGGKTLDHVKGKVEWQDVHFAYPTRSDVGVLKGLKLTLEPGEVVALVGPSGAGKSTIASLLYRLYDPAQGKVLLDGVSLTDLEPNWLRRQIGVVAQEPLLFSASVAENIRYGRPDATDEEVEAAAKMANAHTFISQFPEGYKTLVGERGVQLSGGQKQRVAIARAVLKNPRLLILDEATSALDAESEHLVREALERLMQGRTTLVIAHRLSTVKGANRVVVLDAGRIAQIGTHESLAVEDGIYRRLVERQFAA
ncbi:MAG: ABC transporter transmembrane domain-containing protein [Myxococcaceae bacterium]